MVNGKMLWTSPEVADMVDRLQNGDPTLGWEGDPRLALYWREDGRWEVSRYENGQYSTVCVSRPGVALDARLIMRLVEHDHRRGFDPLAILDEYRPGMSDGQESKLKESLEKVYAGAAKDLGVV